LGNSGIKNYKNLKNLKKNNIFFIYDLVDLEFFVKDAKFVSFLTEIVSYNNLNYTLNEAVGNFLALRKVMKAGDRVLERQGMFDSDHRVSADFNVKLPEVEVNGLPEMLGLSGKPFIRATYPSGPSGSNDNRTPITALERVEHRDSDSDSYNTAPEYHTPGFMENVFAWFKSFNYDHCVLLTLGLNVLAFKVQKTANSTTKKIITIMIIASAYYLLFIQCKKAFDVMMETPRWSNDTCDFFFNSVIWTNSMRVIVYLIELMSGKVVRSTVYGDPDEVVMEDMYQHEATIEELDAHSALESVDIMKTAAGCFLSYLAVSNKLKLQAGAVDYFLSFLNNRDYAVSNLANLMTTCLEFIQDGINFIFKTEVNFVNIFNINKYTSEEAKKFCESVSDKLVKFSTGASEVDAFSHEVFIEDVALGSKLLRKLDRSSYDYNRITMLLKDYERVAIQHKVTMRALSGSRVEPVGLLLRGKPGTKKTIALNRIARLVTRFTLPKMWQEEWRENPDSFVYNIPTDKFWDGYTYKAWVAVADDLFQTRDVAGDADSEALKVIKMINSNPFVLQMADVSVKNTKFFRSAFVVATTNLMNFNQIEAIRDCGAVARRFHLTVDVTVNPKYSALEKDSKIFLEEDKFVMGSEIPNDYWIFTCNGENISLSELVKTMIAFHVDHISDYIVNIKSTYDSVEKLHTELDIDEYGDFGGVFMESMTEPGTLFSKLRNSTKMVNRQSGKDGEYKHLNDVYDKDLDKYYGMAELRSHDLKTVVHPGAFYPASCYQLHASMLKFKHDILNDRLGQALLSLRVDVVRKFFKVANLTEVGYGNFTCFDGIGIMYDYSEIDKIIYIEDREIKVNINHIASRYRVHTQVSDDVYENTPSAYEVMCSCYEYMKNTLSSLGSIVRNNLGTLTILGVAGFALIKVVQRMLKYFFPEEPLVNIDLEELESHTPSPDSPFAKPLNTKKRHVPKQKKGDKIREQGNVNWEGKVDQRRGLRLRTARRKGLSLDGFDTSILGKISTEDVDVINHSDVVTKVLNKYYFIVYVRNVKTDILKKVGQTLNLVGNIFILPHHFLDAIEGHTLDNENDFEIVLTTVNKRIIYRFPVGEFLDSGYATANSLDKDLVYMVLNHAQINSTGAIRYIVDTREYDMMSRMKLVPTCLVGVSLSNNGNTITCKKMDATFDSTSYYVKADSQNEPGYIITNTISYNSNSSKGDCGSLLVTEQNTETGRCILGLHVAGYGEKGVSSTLTYSDICSDLKDCGLDGCYLQEDGLEDLGEHHPLSMESQSGVCHTSVVPDSMAAPKPFKSDITKSEFYGKLPAPYDDPGTLPAKLKPFFDKDGKYIDPYANGLLNYGKDQVCISSSLCSQAAGDYLETIMVSTSNYKYDRIMPLKLKDALHSFRGVGPIMSSTSAGWPLSIDKKNVKKRYYSITSTPEVKEQAYIEIESEVNRLLDMYAVGKRPAFLYTDCLKDEKVSIEKCHLGKTRIFSASPFYLLVLFRMYYGAFMDAYIGANLDVGSAIGVNPYGEQWGYLVHKLKVHGSNEDGEILVGAGDYSKFDGHEQPYLLNLVYRIISDWYGYKNIHASMVRKYLWAEITNSRHIHGKDVYEWFSSMPSGNPLTSIINTMYNNLAFRVAWMFAGNEIGDFHENVYIAALGDDNIFSVSKKFRENFNELKMPELMRKVGMVYTTELKDTAKRAFRPIQEVEFLKRSFVRDSFKNRWIAPLRFSAIIEILNWTKKGEKRHEIAVDNAGLVLREISLHGKQTYDEWYCVIDHLLKEHYKGAKPKGMFSSDFKEVYSSVLDTTNFTL